MRPCAGGPDHVRTGTAIEAPAGRDGGGGAGGGRCRGRAARPARVRPRAALFFAAWAWCFDCLVTVDGRPKPARPASPRSAAGMEVRSAPVAGTRAARRPGLPRRSTGDVLVVGAGPAGLSAGGAPPCPCGGQGDRGRRGGLLPGGQYFKPAGALGGRQTPRPSIVSFRDGRVPCGARR